MSGPLRPSHEQEDPFVAVDTDLVDEHGLIVANGLPDAASGDGLNVGAQRCI